KYTTASVSFGVELHSAIKRSGSTHARLATARARSSRAAWYESACCMRMAARSSSCCCVRGPPAPGSAPASTRSAAVLARSSWSACSARDAISSVLAAKGTGGPTEIAADAPCDRTAPLAAVGGAPGGPGGEPGIGVGLGSAAGDGGSGDGAGSDGDGKSGSGGEHAGPRVAARGIVGGVVVVGGIVGGVVGGGVVVVGGTVCAPPILPPSPTAMDAAIATTAARIAAGRQRAERPAVVTLRSASFAEEARDQW